MNIHRWRLLLGMFMLVAAPVLATPPAASPQGVTCFPADGATGVNPDTHLIITFHGAPTPGSAGNRVAIRGATSSTLTLAGVRPDDAADSTVRVTNASGTAITRAAAGEVSRSTVLAAP